MINERFENIKIGDGFESASRTITESCIMQFAGLTDDHNEIHTSDMYARKTRYGQRISHGLLILSIANGLYVRSQHFGPSVFLGICEWQILNPVFIGDNIRVRVSVAEKRLTSDGGRAVVRMYYEVLNQNDEFVAKGYINRMIDLRENPEL